MLILILAPITIIKILNIKNAKDANLILEFYNFIIFLYITIFLAFVLLFLNFILITQESNFNKNSVYECGFQSFNENISNFNIQYYIIAILFLISDLEIMFLLPWIASLSLLTYSGFVIMIFFLLFLGVGFIYEWKKGSLHWN